MRSVLLALPFGIISTFAHAQSASPEGALALTAKLQTYLGADEGVVAVAPVGGAYAVTIDFAPLIAKTANAAQTKVTPLQYSLSEMGDGTWTMTQDQAFEFSTSVEGEAEISYSIGNISGTSLFDEALGAFRSTSTTARDMKMIQTIADPNMGDTHVEYTIASMRYESAGKAAAAGGVDMTATYSMEGIAETFTLPALGMPLQLSAAMGTGTMQIDAMRPDAIYKLLAFFVANPEQAAMASKQDALKAIVLDGMPLFDHIAASSSMTSLAVQSPVGVFAAADATVTVEANGLVDDGMVREAISLTGIKIPQGLAPDWSTDLLPQSLSIDFNLSGFNPAAGLRTLLAGLDLQDPAQQPDELALMQAFMPEGEVKFTLGQSNVTTPISTLTASGSLNFGAENLPSGKGTVTMTGMTAARQALTKAPPEIGMQAAPVLGMAEGIAKSGENGALIWELEMTRDGQMLVNGVDLQTLGGN